MANVLETIVADKRAEIAHRKEELPLSTFVDGLTPSDRSFYQALAGENAAFVFECKKASPSKGLIRADFNLDEIIAAYSPHAACISVLTDEKYFQGKFEYLEYVRKNLNQPVLNKDFFVEPYQVHLARHHNADAILLMLSVLSDEEYRELSDIALHYNLDVLTEVSNEEECERAVSLGAKIIGINNRDLRDLSTDLATTERLVPLLKNLGHTDLIISESGIYTYADVRRLAPLVDGFLVGSSMMAEQDLAGAVHRLLYSDIKVCGITSIQDAKTVADSPASYAGLIFFSGSKRAVNESTAKAIVTEVPGNYVGVFVNEDPALVARLANELNLKAVQLHGNEDQAYIDNLKPQLPGDCQIWQVKAVENTLPALNDNQVDAFLLDCKVGDQTGGTGQAFNWQLLDEVSDKSKLIVAGGLNPQNITEASALGVKRLDLNSGVETAPGIKDQTKLTQAFNALRSY